jgi:hypothetical protein
LQRALYPERMTTYTFSFTPEEKEALFLAFSHAARVGYASQALTPELIEALNTTDRSGVELSQEQLGAALRGLTDVLEESEKKNEQWAEVDNFKRTRSNLLTMSRKQYQFIC